MNSPIVRRKWDWGARLGVFLFYLALSFLAMLPASVHPTTHKWGSFKGSDSLMCMYTFWWRSEVHTSDPDGRPWNYLLGAPQGSEFHYRLSNPHYLGRPFTWLGGPVLAYNALVFGSFLLAGLLMHIFLFSICGCHYSAGLGGVVFTLSPFHQLQAADHLFLAQTWLFPAFLFAWVGFMAKKTCTAAFPVALMVALALFIHGYYGIFLLGVLGCLLLYMLIDGQLPLRSPATCRVLILFAVLLFLGALAYLWDTGYVSVTGDGGPMVPSRPIDDLRKYGIRWYEFLLPPYYSLVFGSAVRDFLRTHHHGSNLAEITIFLGYTPLALTIAFLWLRSRATWRFRGATGTQASSPEPAIVEAIDPKVVWVLGIVGLIPFLVGVPPRAAPFGFEIPTLSAVLHTLVPMLRTLSRFAILTICSVSCFASFGFHRIVRRKSSTVKRLLWIICVALVYVEFTNVQTGFYLDTAQVPPVYQAVAVIPEPVTVLELPFEWGFMPEFWQTFHHKALYNLWAPGSLRYREIIRLQAAPSLQKLMENGAKLGIDLLIIHSNQPLGVGTTFENELNNDVILPQNARYSTLVPLR